MKFINHIFNKHRDIAISILAIIAFALILQVFAATTYGPGDTLDPAEGPGDAVVDISGPFEENGVDVVRQTSNTFDEDFVFGSPALIYDGQNDSRFFFDEANSAFRAGATDDNSWDFGNVGQYSFAVGYDPVASGDNSIAIGSVNQALANGAVAIGSGVTASGNTSVAIGTSLSATGENAVAIGRESVASDSDSFSLGADLISSGVGSFALGSTIHVTGDNSFGFGLDGTVRTVSAESVFSIVGGNVGIGTVAPTNDLSVVGTANITGNLTVGSCTGCGADSFWDSLSDNIFNTNSGGVGIGTDTPLAPLDVFNGNEGGEYNTLLLSNIGSVAGSYAISFSNGNNPDYARIIATDENTEGPSHLAFWVKDTNGDPFEGLIIDHDGNVDIPGNLTVTSCDGCGGSTTIIPYSGFVDPGVTRYVTWQSVTSEESGNLAINSGANFVSPRNGTIKRLSIFVSNNDLVDDSVLTIRVSSNGGAFADTPITITVGAGETGGFSSASDVSIAEFDRISLEVESGAGATGIIFNGGLEIQ